MNFSRRKSFSVLSLGLFLALVFLVLGSLLGTSGLAQQNSALGAIYGRGVHAYFAGKSSQAEQYFTQVIQTGSTDPRPYYFRAMLRLGQGRQVEAEKDMQVGATYEARDLGSQHAMGRSLQRVQGPSRRTLETFRRQARLDRLQQGQRQTRQRYEQLDRRGPTVIRRVTPLPLEQPIGPPQQLAVPEPAPSLGNTQPSVTPIDDPLGSMETPVPATEADPFGEVPPYLPGEADPFGETSAPAQETPQPERIDQPETTDDDPFGEGPSVESQREEEGSHTPVETDEADPFGESTIEEPMPAESPVEQSPVEQLPEETASDDPFGEGEETSSDSSIDKESAGEEDPFGETSESVDSGSSDSSSSDSSSSDSGSSETDDSETDDPFGETMEEESESAGEDSAPAEEDAPAPELDEEDPFGGF